MPAISPHFPALVVNIPGRGNVVPEMFREHVANILAAHWPNVEVTLAPTSNAGQPRETLTNEQLNILRHGRLLLADRNKPVPEDYRLGIIEMLALQMFDDVAETERVTAHLDPWPPVDDTTLTTLGHLVVKTLREGIDQPWIDSINAIRQHARDLGIVFTI